MPDRNSDSRDKRRRDVRKDTSGSLIGKAGRGLGRRNVRNNSALEAAMKATGVKRNKD